MANQRTGAGAPENTITHQTVELRRGRHGSPEQGACVVELASMLAEEPFSDHPRSVCPVVGAYMRTLNDGLSDSARQSLYCYAAAIVGTRGSRRVRRARARACARWAHELGAVSRLRARLLGTWGGAQAVGSLCAKAALRSGEGDSFYLDLADRLIGMGQRDRQLTSLAEAPVEEVAAGS